MNHHWPELTSCILLAGTALGLAGCTRHTIDVQPIRVEPIHMIVDVNVKVDRELDRFFDFEDEVAATQPADVQTSPPAASPSAAAPSPGLKGESS
jgi:hypothetical protein